MVHSSPFPSDSFIRVLCYYVNGTNQVQIARIANLINGCFERIVFPGQRLFFEAPLDAELEIYSGTLSTLFNRIPCLNLRVTETLFPSDIPQPELD